MKSSEAKKIIVITGPTATGKSAIGIALAKEIGGEVVSADSMQVYKYMDIGTAKPTKEEMRGIAHHMIDVVPPWEDYSVARYVKEASLCVEGILSSKKIPIIVGGTGLYIDSLIRGHGFVSRPDPELRKKLEEKYDTDGGEAMLLELSNLDKKRAEKLHPNDKKRIVRAFEAVLSGNVPISRHDEKTKTLPPRYSAIKIALTYTDRALLYERIDRRVDAMITAGLKDEVAELLKKGVSKNATAMQAIGYKEMQSVLDKTADLSTAAEIIKTQSRRYAKRQMTWLRRDDNIKWIAMDSTRSAAPGSTGNSTHTQYARMILEMINEAK
ncbi:MAG: tRNA (adenosine(37)-N6)-dimethylallyltransferase MiaA [Oscillospiraceae bacterium]|nr:tRNA (adenosine(37)-N6)-dimethylallyltransferase MiaA [Oscillospiraceae bacterium]